MSPAAACPNSSAIAAMNGHHQNHEMMSNQVSSSCTGKKVCEFQMPLHYPRYKKSDYERMPEWQLNCLLKEYGLPVEGDVDQKRKFAMGAFLWPDQL